ncbi:MAG: DUF448 domain-containing protein [Campylobacterales bacterium]|nr:DUF448 domain-containing protein [Campylobacterales bacterium]
MSKFPIRTCIVCRDKQDQRKLLRIQCIDKELSLFTGVGRSSYICSNCLNGEEKKLQKALNRYCKSNGDYIAQLKEILADGR